MTLIAVSQRVDVIRDRGERRDTLDQAWARFFDACGLVPVPVPNRPDTARQLLRQLPIAGIVLTGGNDLAAYGGDAPERDLTEQVLLEEAEQRGLPVIGVCRGMQAIQHAYGVELAPVSDHVQPQQVILLDGEPVEVNSYHHWGTVETVAALHVWARAADGIVEAVRDTSRRRLGIMWHPERFREPSPRDVALFQNWFTRGRVDTCRR